VTVRAIVSEDRGRGIEVVCEDNGPGIANVELVMQDGYSTSSGLGMGLPGAKRLMDEFEIETRLDVGTRVTVKRWLR
jgi:serine/threonine-protein kinase RsbT